MNKNIPKNLIECFGELSRELSPENIEEIRSGKEEDMVQHHHGLGRYLRNEWGLWQDSLLPKWFNEKGIHHPDDMSGIILTSFWRSINSKPIQLEEQIKHYQDYWTKLDEEE